MIVGIVANNVLGVMDLTDSKALGVLLVGLFFQGQNHAIFYLVELTTGCPSQALGPS